MGASGITVEAGQDGDAAMHARATIDDNVVLSGKIDLELPGGKVHTLVPGDLLVDSGDPHAWKNRYDEDCLFLVNNVGFTS
ncbi:Cupin domain-containing protein [Geodermatophilus amargosae]|uniref:Cupin domain-containing protein n=2 Tax=Geodermatophilus amargosae TaxID=1296565 RepID=A0A1I7CPE5_9ACTN|nr:Cupin domain-containing protein [Geodermatophilus amargosae]